MPHAKSKRHQEPPRRPGKSFWTKARVALALTAVAAVMVVALVTYSSGRKKGPPDPIFDAEIQALDGSTFRLSDYDDKVVVLNFWATWCGPCRLEVPHLVEINREYGGRGVEVVGLSTEDPVVTRDKVRDFAGEFKMDYRVGFADRQWAMQLMRDRTNIPQVFVLREGRVLNRFIGFNPQTSPQRLREAIEQALKGK